jgi:hypothetical protein
MDIDPNLGTPEIAAAPPAKRVAGRWPLVSGLVALALAFGLGALIVVRDKGLPLTVDVEWMRELIEHRAPIWKSLSLVMDSLGGGVVAVFILPVGIAAALFLAKRPWAAGYYLVATVVAGGLVQLLSRTSSGAPDRRTSCPTSISGRSRPAMWPTRRPWP